ncbi:hypothetical protein EV2_024459 [Malus domestica]
MNTMIQAGGNLPVTVSSSTPSSSSSSHQKLYQRALEHLLQVFDKLKELFMSIGASASLSNAFNRLKEPFVIRNVDNQLAMESDQQNGLL